jgi:hypothetical protein
MILLNITQLRQLDQKQHYLKVDDFNNFDAKNTISLTFIAVIHHTIDTSKRSADTYLFKYVLEHANTYNIQITKRNSVS